MKERQQQQDPPVPVAGQFWRNRNPKPAEYRILAVAHTKRPFERMVIFVRMTCGRRAYGERVWAYPLDEFVREFTFAPVPRHAKK